MTYGSNKCVFALNSYTTPHINICCWHWDWKVTSKRLVTWVIINRSHSIHVVEVINEILGWEEITGSRAEKTNSPPKSNEIWEPPTEMQWVFIRFTLTSTMCRSTNLGLVKILSMGSHLSGVSIREVVTSSMGLGGRRMVPGSQSRYARGRRSLRRLKLFS